MKAHHALCFHVVKALPKQLAGNALPLVPRGNSEVVDFENTAIMEQHGCAQNEACNFSVNDALQAVMLLVFKQFANMDGCILNGPSVVPWLSRKRCRVYGSILVQVFYGAWFYCHIFWVVSSCLKLNFVFPSGSNSCSFILVRKTSHAPCRRKSCQSVSGYPSALR